MRTLVLSLLFVKCNLAAAAQATAWQAGPAFNVQLEQPITYSGTEVPLRDALRRLSQSQQVAVLLDRRIDPDQRLDASFNAAPLRQVFAQIAADHSAAVSLAAPVVYVGPASVCRTLRTLIALRTADVARLPAAARKGFQKSAAWSWDDLVSPRELLDALAAEAGIRFIGLEQVPHDLWGGGDLPAMPWAERLALVAAQFDLTFQLSSDGTRVTLVPVSPDVKLERTYAAGPRAKERVEQWSKLCPDCEITHQGGRILVRGLVEDHERLAAPTMPTPRPSQPGEQRYTLTVKDQPVGAIIEALRKKLNLEIRVDTSAIMQAGVSLDQRVSFEANQVTLDALLDAVLKPAGLAHRSEGNVILVSPRG